MLIIHHWDTDGICSAAKLVKALKPESFVNMSPEIGDFSFGRRIRDAIEEHDEVYVLDLNLPHEVEGARKRITFIDHHIQGRIQNEMVEQINPLVEGKDPKDYPSCTTVLSDHFGDWDLLSALGAVGDVGEKALDVPKVREQLDLAGIGYREAQHIVSLIDSNYLAVDLGSVEEAVRTVLSSGTEELMNRPEWVRRFGDIKKTIEESLGRREELDGFAIVDYSSPYNIVSKLARKAVWEMGYSGALVINRDFHGKGQTYFRVSPETAERIDIASIIAKLKDIGINAGGKREVVGSVYPVDRTEEVLGIIRPHLPMKKTGGNIR
ncbi:MAG: DHH family phosphoesterase [Thermoplasmatota archaeon]